MTTIVRERAGAAGDGAGGGAGGAIAQRDGLRRWVGRPLAIYAASRLLVGIVWSIIGSSPHSSGYRAAVMRWDSWWYYSIVQHGYRPQPAGTQSNIAFFPLYPALSSAVGRVAGLDHYAAMSLAAVLLYGFTRELLGDRAAMCATVLFVFAPGSFALSMLYSEGVFLACAIGACWALWRRRWAMGGVAALLAGLARPTGVVLVIVCIAVAIEELTRNPLRTGRPRDPRVLVAPVLAPLGYLGFFAHLWGLTGSATAWFDLERTGWHQGFDVVGPRLAEMGGTVRSLLGRPVEWPAIIGLAGLAVAVVGVVALVRWRPPFVIVAYSAALGVFVIASSDIGFRPRMLLVAFPLAMAFGHRLERSRWFWPVLAASASAMVTVAVVVARSNLLVP